MDYTTFDGFVTEESFFETQVIANTYRNLLSFKVIQNLAALN